MLVTSGCSVGESNVENKNPDTNHEADVVTTDHTVGLSFPQCVVSPRERKSDGQFGVNFVYAKTLLASPGSVVTCGDVRQRSFEDDF